MPEEKEYIVAVRQVHFIPYKVKAADPREAIQKAVMGRREEAVIDNWEPFYQELHFTTWRLYDAKTMKLIRP